MTCNATWILIPVKGFQHAKTRLASALAPTERAHLAATMATHVVESAAPLPVAIACDDPEVAQWAQDLGATVIWCPGTDLNGAVQHGVAELTAKGAILVVVAHSDLPLAAGFKQLIGWPGVTLVPDRHGAGTNVIAVPTSLGFQFSFGVDSFRRHVREAARLRRGLRIVHEPNLSWDVDEPEDLAALQEPGGVT